MATRSIFVNFDNDNPAKPEERRTASELDQAEHNFDVILRAAAQTSQILRPWVELETDRLVELVADLKALFTLIRREMNQRSQCLNYEGRKPVAPPKAKMPQNLQKKAYYDCLCPLTVFLQAVATALSDLNLRISPGGHQWGTITPLWTVLNGMQSKFQRPPQKQKEANVPRDAEPDLCSGIATLVMFHERHGRFTVAATAARYLRLTGLNDHSVQLREKYIRNMESQLSREAVARISTLVEYSEGVKKASNAVRQTRPPQPPSVGAVPGGKEKIPGCNASFGNTGNYRTACLMDFFRFDIRRPMQAQEQEDRFMIIRRMAFKSRSCAEWELYVKVLFDPDPVAPRPPPPAVRRDTLHETKKPKTWDTKQAPPRPAWKTPYGENQMYHRPAKPPPLNADLRRVPAPRPQAPGTQWPGARVNEKQSATFSHKPLQTHPAAGQIVRPTKKRSCFGF